MTERRVFLWALAGLLGAKLFLMILSAPNPLSPIDFLRPVDDAFISYRYAENVAHGRGLAYNPGDRVEGGTSIGLIALLTPFSFLGVARLDFIAVIMSLLASAATVALAYRLMRRDNEDEPRAGEGFALVYLTLSVSVLVWAWAGMEAALLSTVWLAAILRHLRERDQARSPWLSALLTVAAGWLHPDGILIAVVLGLSWLIPFDKKRAIRGVAYGTIVVAVFGAYWLWRWRYFGYPMPNTFYVKAGDGGLSLAKAGLTYVRVAWIATLVPLIALYYGIRRARSWRTWPRWAFLMLGLAAIYTAYVIKVGGDFYPFHRFYVALMPAFTLLAWRWRRDALAERGVAAAPLTRARVLRLVLLVALMNLWSFIYTFQGLIHRDLQRVVMHFATVGRALQEATPEDAVVATLPIGAVGFFSKRPIHDMMGLVDLHIARVEHDEDRGIIGHQKFDHAYTLAQRPNLVMVLPSLYSDDEAGFRKWINENSLEPTQYRIYEQTALREQYRLVRLPVGRLAAFGFLRADLVGATGYDRWRTMSDEETAEAFTTPQRAAAHPLHGRSFGIWSFK